MASAVHRQVPSRLDTVVFEAKAAVFRGLRAWDEALARKATRRHARGDALCDAPVVARVRSPLWNGARRREGIRAHRRQDPESPHRARRP